jgi:predicted DNA-binding protein (MmcQ/YjbR family)
MSISRNDVITYIKKEYDVIPEYTFKKFPNYCIFRHKSNKKWFGLIMNIPKKKLYAEGEGEIDIIDVKINPEISHLMKQKKGYFPAYHMNKEHWISIDLSRIEDINELKNLIQDSFNLTIK